MTSVATSSYDVRMREETLRYLHQDTAAARLLRRLAQQSQPVSSIRPEDVREVRLRGLVHLYRDESYVLSVFGKRVLDSL